MFDYKKVQSEVEEWVAFNFPNAEKHHPLLGLNEEFNGELATAFLKGDRVGTLDALGDICIFLTHYCIRNEIDLEQAIMLARQNIGDLNGVADSYYWYMLASIALGTINHGHLKLEQGIRGSAVKQRGNIIAGIGAFYHGLRMFAGTQFLSLENDAFGPTWEQVKQRNWQANPLTGESAPLPEAETSLQFEPEGISDQGSADPLIGEPVS